MLSDEEHRGGFARRRLRLGGQRASVLSSAAVAISDARCLREEYKVSPRAVDLTRRATAQVGSSEVQLQLRGASAGAFLEYLDFLRGAERNDCCWKLGVPSGVKRLL